MAAKMTLDELLEQAIQKEIMSRLLYVCMRQGVKSKSAKDAFQQLAEQEECHQRLLEKYRQGKLKEGVLRGEQVIDYRIAEHLDQPDLSPKMELKDVFLLAANREKASHQLYLGLSMIHPEGQVKKLLEDLANQELEHKNRIETIYNEVAFPQTDGG